MNPQCTHDRSNHTNRRSVLKTIGIGVPGTTAVAGIGAVGTTAVTGVASADHGARETVPTWGSDGTDEWEMLDTGYSDTPPVATAPIYGIAPSGGEHSPHFDAAPYHDAAGPIWTDLVVDTPGCRPGEGGYYSAVWHVLLVVAEPAPEPDGSDLVTFENPTISNIDAEVHDDDDLFVVSTPIEFICPVRPRREGRGRQGRGRQNDRRRPTCLRT